MQSESRFAFLFLAEKEGFEPSRRVTDLLVFEARPFSHLGTPPKWSQKTINDYTNNQNISQYEFITSIFQNNCLFRWQFPALSYSDNLPLP